MHQHAIAVVLVDAAVGARLAMQRVVGVRCGAVAQQVACGVVTEADHLVGGVVTAVLHLDAVFPRVGAVACQIVGVAVIGAHARIGPG
ncbi:hypothetical protein HC891_14075 [Candidatus Gracilibacteria bacterium]|nr:hypothetical protein [Candidatus Gracilibacteria bacterium]